MSFSIGSLVKARGREWVVLPESEEDLLVLRPLGGTDDEVTGIYLPLEKVEPAYFDLPDPQEIGDYRSARLLRDAVRLGFRSSAGPFRSFARLAVEPRPYQLVPLLMALKLNPVRLLIADDVGIGKTIEAGLIARELLDRGEIQRLAVLCPPPLAEQWQAELREKFHIQAELVLSSTASRLERGTRLGQSLFDVYPFVVVSTDFIKTDRRRAEFLRTCPEMVIVDEAHTCAFAGTGRHQRFQLVFGLASNADRHLLLVTATPHSGKEDAFRSLLTFLDTDFSELPEDLTGPENVHYRRQLAMHFVQRRRGDIRHYLDADTPFPEREDAEATYTLSAEYKSLFEKILDYARETVREPDKDKFHRRVRWWSALALLRSMASSPVAAAATLRNRAATVDVENPEQVDEIGRRTVLDLMDLEAAENVDVTPGGDVSEIAADEERNRRRLLSMAREADRLQGKHDHKLQRAIELVKELLDDGFHPILFCRFIPTAEYLAAELRQALRGVEVIAVTGLLPPAEREARVKGLAEASSRVLVSTDCLSEGINLQAYFDAVVHYDLSWNPTRHEQREGRVDRYGQPRPVVRTLTYYGIDNQIDGIVLDVLIRKHQTIRNSLGISVPVPVNSDQVIEAIFEGLLLREQTAPKALMLPGFEELLTPQKEAFFQEWEAATEREKRSRTMFAQETIKVDEVAQELQAARAAVGYGANVASFTKEALRAYGAAVSDGEAVQVDLRETPQALRDRVGEQKGFSARFEMPIQEDEIYLTRTHPIVEGLANYVMDAALDPVLEGVARRCGAIRTRQVEQRTTLLVVRYRYHLISQRGDTSQPLLAEEAFTMAFEGSPQNPTWLSEEVAEALLYAEPDANIHPAQAGQFVSRVIEGYSDLKPYIEGIAEKRAEELLEAHRRVRSAARIKSVRYNVQPQLPADVLGIYVYLPI